MSILSCKESDCQRKVLARGMCSTHYSYWHRERNGRVDKAYSKECDRCRATFTTTTRGTSYCSLTCAQRHRAHKNASLVRYTRPRVWLGLTLAPRNGCALVAGQCAYCPNYFIGLPGARYCSSKCSTNADWKRRYDRRGEFKVTDKVRRAIYERDNYTCQLCQEPVDVALHYNDRMSPTLDHVTPQSHTLFPDHSKGNLRLAHRLCNSVRGDKVELAA